MKSVFICAYLSPQLTCQRGQMSAAIDEDGTGTLCRGLAGRFAGEPPSGADPAEIWPRLWFTVGALIIDLEHTFRYLGLT
jgi:hypothetical protein